jgi:hypothetical protein
MKVPFVKSLLNGSKKCRLNAENWGWVKKPGFYLTESSRWIAENPGFFRLFPLFRVE